MRKITVLIMFVLLLNLPLYSMEAEFMLFEENCINLNLPENNVSCFIDWMTYDKKAKRYDFHEPSLPQIEKFVELLEKEIQKELKLDEKIRKFAEECTKAQKKTSQKTLDKNVDKTFKKLHKYWEDLFKPKKYKIFGISKNKTDLSVKFHKKAEKVWKNVLKMKGLDNGLDQDEKVSLANSVPVISIAQTKEDLGEFVLQDTFGGGESLEETKEIEIPYHWVLLDTDLPFLSLNRSDFEKIFYSFVLKLPSNIKFNTHARLQHKLSEMLNKYQDDVAAKALEADRKISESSVRTSIENFSIKKDIHNKKNEIIDLEKLNKELEEKINRNRKKITELNSQIKKAESKSLQITDKDKKNHKKCIAELNKYMETTISKINNEVEPEVDNFLKTEKDRNKGLKFSIIWSTVKFTFKLGKASSELIEMPFSYKAWKDFIDTVKETVAEIKKYTQDIEDAQNDMNEELNKLKVLLENPSSRNKEISKQITETKSVMKIYNNKIEIVDYQIDKTMGQMRVALYLANNLREQNSEFSALADRFQNLFDKVASMNNELIDHMENYRSASEIVELAKEECGRKDENAVLGFIRDYINGISKEDIIDAVKEQLGIETEISPIETLLENLKPVFDGMK